MVRSFAIALLGLILLAGCNLDTRECLCASNNECPASTGDYGMCVRGHCAFRSGSCPSGWVYDETGGSVADQCVPEADLMTDAGAVGPDAGPRPDAAAPTVDAAPASDGAIADAASPDA